MRQEAEYQMEVHAIAHWLDLTPEDCKTISELVDQSCPQNGREYDLAWEKWERLYRIGAAMSYLRDKEREWELNVKREIEEITKP